MAHGITSRSARLSLGSALLLLAGALFVLNPGSALAHHVALAKSTTCNSYLIEADYFGGDGERYAEVRVNNVLVGTYTFIANSGDHDNFYVNSGPLPANLTVGVKLFQPQAGPDTLIDTDVVTVNAAATCATWTPTNTPTPGATSTPTSTVTAVPTNTPAATPTATATDTATSTATATETTTATATATATGTPIPTHTPTVTETSTSTPISTETPGVTETATPVSTATNTPPTATSTPGITETTTPVPTATNTPRPTNTPGNATGTAEAAGTTTADGTPTYISTVEALLPPERPGVIGNPPGENASALPDAGQHDASAEGTIYGLLAALLAGAGLAVIASGLRRDGAGA